MRDLPADIYLYLGNLSSGEQQYESGLSLDWLLIRNLSETFAMHTRETSRAEIASHLRQDNRNF